jgi:hypothetical protein
VIPVIAAVLLICLFLLYIFFFRGSSQPKKSRLGKIKGDPVYRPGKRESVHCKIIECIVKGQNKNVGFRNVHRIDHGQSLCFGGDGSPFVIFLYPFPRCIGKVENSKGSIHFIPLKKEYFTNQFQTVRKNCLNYTIELISDTNKHVTFFFQEYISPLERINRIMCLTKTSGLPI